MNKQFGSSGSVMLFPLLLVLLSFALRLFRLDSQSLWWDEGISLHLATSSVGDLLIDRLNNIHPPFYFMALKGWLNLTGVSAFTARYLSVLGSVVLIPLTFAVARDWYGRKAALIIAGLTSISAVFVIYAQEARVYAWLPLVYVGLLATTHSLLNDKRNARPGGRMWLALGLISWLGLHLHYVSLFVIVYVALWFVLTSLVHRRWYLLKRWILVQVAVIATSAPWYLALLNNYAGVRAEAVTGTFSAEATPLPFLLAQVWLFQLTGLAGALARPLLVALGLIAFLILSVLIVFQTTRGHGRQIAALTAHWLLPLSGALVVWSVRSFSHPRYVVIFVPGLLLLAGLISVFPKRSSVFVGDVLTRVVAAGLLTTLALASVGGLYLYFSGQGAAKDDMRAVALILSNEAGENDLILVPDTDWSLPFEFNGATKIAMPHIEQGKVDWTYLASLTEDVTDVYLLDYARGTRDWQNLMPFALERAGDLSMSWRIDDLILQRYQLHSNIVKPELVPAAVNFGTVQLKDAWIEDESNVGVMTVALRWHLPATTGDSLRIALRLFDTSGWPQSRRDEVLVDSLGRASNQWGSGQELVTYHLVPVPSEFAPGRYELGLSVYIGEQTPIKVLDRLDESGAPIGQEVIIAKPLITTTELSTDNPYGFEPLLPAQDSRVLMDGLVLEGSRFPAALNAGEELVVDLLWLADNNMDMDLQPLLALVQDGQILDSTLGTLLVDRFPTSLWRTGQHFAERRFLRIPTSSAGEVDLVIMLDEMIVPVASLDIEDTGREFREPDPLMSLDVPFNGVARLAGVDLTEATINPNEPLPIKLYWQALPGERAIDYVVFVHVLDDRGRLIGQHDGQPQSGERPLTGWIAGEYIADEHVVVFRDQHYAGPATIQVGIYDPLTQERLLLAGGEDHFLLPATLEIVP